MPAGAQNGRGQSIRPNRASPANLIRKSLAAAQAVPRSKSKAGAAE
jgi:hypothetical protein